MKKSQNEEFLMEPSKKIKICREGGKKFKINLCLESTDFFQLHPIHNFCDSALLFNDISHIERAFNQTKKI